MIEKLYETFVKMFPDADLQEVDDNKSILTDLTIIDPETCNTYIITVEIDENRGLIAYGKHLLVTDDHFITALELPYDPGE